MDEWLQGLFNPATSGWGAGGSMTASAPQITPSMLYPFTGVGSNMTPDNAPWMQPPTMSGTNAEGQPMDENGMPVPPLTGGSLPTPMSYARMNLSGGQNASGGADRLLSTLRGLKAPDAPVAQRVATPHVAPIKPIQSGELINLLSSLGVSPKDVLQHPRIQVPMVR